MDIEKYNMLQRNYTKKNIKLNLVSLLIISIIELKYCSYKILL